MQSPATSSAEAPSLKIPGRFGEVIYQINAKSPNQLFIIGIAHRDTLTRANGSNTTKVQAEVYEIGDWLIHHEGLELLLPEGFFKDKAGKAETERIKAELEKSVCAGSPDMKEIEETLADDKVFVNAEMLLKKNHRLKLKQIEDEDSYEAVHAGILKLIRNRNNSCDLLSVKSELDYLQEKRTAAMLQRIPGVVEQEFEQGDIKARRAIFTIGMSHLRKIIQYLNEQKIRVFAPGSASNKGEEYVAGLNLQKENFGTTVILPRILANDQHVLMMNRLDTIVTRSRVQSPPAPSVAQH